MNGLTHTFEGDKTMSNDDKALIAFGKMSGDEVRRGLMIIRHLKNHDLDLDNEVTKNIYHQAYEAAEILSNKQVKIMIDELVELNSLALLR